MTKSENLLGQRFGRLDVIGVWDKRANGTRWICECSCGNLALVRTANLVSGKSRSCGCLMIESFSRAVARVRARSEKVDALVRDFLNDDL